MHKRSELNIPGIYTITCQPTGKVYVGQAINVRKRWGAHRWHLERGVHRNRHLQRAWTKHGASAFAFEVAVRLEGIPKDELRAALGREEMAVLATVKRSFNLMTGLHETVVASPETRELRRRQQKERWADPVQRERILQGIAAKAADPEFQVRRGKAIAAGKSSPEWKAKASSTAKRIWAEPGAKAKRGLLVKANWADPEYRERQTASRKAAAADPEVRAKRAAGLRAAHARKKAAGLPWKSD